jgi:hypothetical protein
VLAHVVGAMAVSLTDRICYFVVQRLGLSRRGDLRAIAWRDMVLEDPLRTRLQDDEIEGCASVAPDQCPTTAPNAGSRADPTGPDHMQEVRS